MSIGGLQQAGRAPDVTGLWRGFTLRDPQDRDGDGYVSDLERRRYLLTHPGAARLARLKEGEASAGTPKPTWTSEPSTPPAVGRARARTEVWGDPMDLDGNGVVTPLEELTYLAEHPLEALTYDQRGGAKKEDRFGGLDGYA